VVGRFPISGGAKPTPFRGSGPHSPPRWRTRGRRSESPLPFARKELFQGSVWPADFAWPWDSTRTVVLDRASHTLPPLRHTNGGVLAEPFNNSKKREWGQSILVRALDDSSLTGCQGISGPSDDGQLLRPLRWIYPDGSHYSTRLDHVAKLGTLQLLSSLRRAARAEGLRQRESAHKTKSDAATNYERYPPPPIPAN
jgi:hypothetical protein